MLENGFDSATIDRYGSVLGTIQGNRKGKSILLDGHIDTVDISNPSQWTHAPYEAEIVDGKIFGRGTSDMKGSVAAMILAAAFYAEDTKRDFAGTISVSCTVHEECFEGISAREITKAVKPDFVVIGEATTTTLKRGQRGRAEIVVETEGKTCHSSNPDKGINAVYHMLALIEEIRKIEPNTHPVLGKGILELTDIISSPYPGASVVPGRCRVTYDRRTLVGETAQSVLQPIAKAIETVKQAIPELKAKAYIAEGSEACWTGETIQAKRFFPAWMMEKEAPLVQKALEGLREAGIEATLSHFSFCTNGSHFCGEEGIPTIGFGPSREDLAHVIDEYIEIEQLTKACKGFGGIIAKVLA
jgi:putative selenium metabolism hydrolase